MKASAWERGRTTTRAQRSRRARMHGYFVLGEKNYIRTRHAAPRVGYSEARRVYFVSGMDIGNITLDGEQFETIEEALKRACAIEKTGALVELFEDDNPTPVMDFAQVTAWCRANSQ